jgi:CubicO group peptidase (beta-lactamase class C family)
MLLGAVSLLPGADDAEIRSLLDNRVNVARRANGIVVGLLDDKGRRILSEGPRLDGDTVFEIGSITKAFTAILLADMSLRGEVKLDDPVSKYLPESVKMPAYQGRQITLLDLTTQTSGLPRMPGNFHPADPSNPYADYTPAQMYEFLSSYTLTRAPGEKYDYSNLGVGLLGNALARRAGKSYEELVTERILKPLQMTRSSITLSAAQKANFAPGHAENLSLTANWDLPTFAGAGALRSTANDMLRFLAANMTPPDTPLGRAMALSHGIRKPTGMPEVSIAMGWHVTDKHGTPIVWHNGGTGGYRTWAGFAPSTKTAVVVLCNTSFGVDDLGLHFTAASYPAAKLKPEVKLERDTLLPYVGRYELTPAFVIAITEADGNLSLQATGQPKVRLYPESPKDFSIREVPASITFERSDTGAVTGLILHQGGVDQKARRVP